MIDSLGNPHQVHTQSCHVKPPFALRPTILTRNVTFGKQRKTGHSIQRPAAAWDNYARIVQLVSSLQRRQVLSTGNIFLLSNLESLTRRPTTHRLSCPSSSARGNRRLELDEGLPHIPCCFRGHLPPVSLLRRAPVQALIPLVTRGLAARNQLTNLSFFFLSAGGVALQRVPNGSTLQSLHNRGGASELFPTVYSPRAIALQLRANCNAFTEISLELGTL